MTDMNRFDEYTDDLRRELRKSRFQNEEMMKILVSLTEKVNTLESQLTLLAMNNKELITHIASMHPAYSQEQREWAIENLKKTDTYRTASIETDPEYNFFR